jgi:hypothetical protein
MAVGIPPEAKRFETPSEPLNIPADRLQKEMGWIDEADIPPQIRNAIAATIWLLQVDAFRKVEESFMLEEKYETHLQEHRATLSAIIAQGEQLVLAASKEGMICTPAGFQLEDLRATLNSLHTTFRCQHGPHNPPKTDQLIEQLLLRAN